MSKNEIAVLKAEIQREENLYLVELKTTQKYEKLKVIRRKIKSLKQRILGQQISEPPIDGLSFM